MALKRAPVFATAAAALWAVGCTKAPPEPEPVPSPDLAFEVPSPPERDYGWTPPEEPRWEEPDPIVHSRWAYHEVIESRVDAWTNRFTRRERGWFEAYLQRMGRYAPYVDSTLTELELPHSLRYLPIVESGYSPSAVSPAAAAGLWQFMAPVARGFGMRVDAVLDERRDPFVATPYALQFLGDLNGRFNSWFLALAAYNGGPNRVSRLIRQHAPLSPMSDSLFLVIRPHLPRETREFVPKFLAAAKVAGSPTRYGFDVPSEVVPLRFDVVTVPDATTLDVVARAAGASESEIEDLNPHLVRNVTPRGRVTPVRIPLGRATAFREAYARIPPNERVTVTEHVVRSGETLSEIAEQYGIRTAELQAANPRVQARRMRVGTRLVVPLVPRSRR